MDTLFRKVRSESNMFAAWRHVKRSALSSSNGEIRGAASEFEHEHQRHIGRCIDQLRKSRFVFDPVQGVLADKKAREKLGKSPRPIAIATLKNRLVQRAILQVLQPRRALNPKTVDTRYTIVQDDLLGDINKVNRSRFGVGGLMKPYGGVGPAISLIMSAIKSGARHYYRSDIKAFFTNIPVEPVVKFVRQQTGDDEFADLFSRGLEVQLSNKDQLATYATLFPSNGHGVAQGSSLSAFAGNVLLYELDHEINKLGVCAVRYIDDVLIVSPDENSLERAIRYTRDALSSFGFTIYQPELGSDKAAKGICADAFGFLGCTLQPNRCVPSSQSIQKMKDGVNSVLSESTSGISKCIKEGEKLDHKLAIGTTLHKLGLRIYGWQKSFSFCTDGRPFSELDTYIDRRIMQYDNAIRRLLEGSPSAVRARVLGIPSTKEMFQTGQHGSRSIGGGS